MSKTLYNEGRVVGYSAYEAYVKGYIESSDGNGTPASEREWLASSLASGSSMILKIAANTSAGVHDYPLPSTSNLVAANNITGSLFLGNCEFTDNWATKITDYGELIPNNSTTSPSNGNVPYDTNATNIHKSQILQFVKIEDGIIYQSGNWSDNTTSDTPTKNLEADFKDYKTPTVRLKFSEEIKSDICILLTGFTDLEVVKGVTGLDSSIDTASPQNGDFIGPATFPWAAKIIFSQPNNTSYILQDGIVSGSGNVIITPNHEDGTTSIEVKNAIMPGAYYDFEALQDQTKYDLYNFTELENIKHYLGSNVIIGQNPAEHGGTTYIGALTYVKPLDIETPFVIKSPIKATRINDAFGTIGLNLNLNAGYGIDIDKSDNTWLISLVDTDSKYIDLNLTDDYTLSWGSYFGSYAEDSNNRDSDSDISIKLQPVKDNKGNIVRVYFKINGSWEDDESGKDHYLGCSNLIKPTDDTKIYKFNFRHTVSINGEGSPDPTNYKIIGNNSKIVGIKFKSNTTKIPGINLNKLNNATIVCETQQVGIWNIRGPIDRASWNANCRVQYDPSEYEYNDDNTATTYKGHSWISAIGYADGYNNQLFLYPNEATDDNPVYSTHMNLSISGYYQL